MYDPPPVQVSPTPRLFDEKPLPTLRRPDGHLPGWATPVLAAVTGLVLLGGLLYAVTGPGGVASDPRARPALELVAENMPDAEVLDVAVKINQHGRTCVYLKLQSPSPFGRQTRTALFFVDGDEVTGVQQDVYWPD